MVKMLTQKTLSPKTVALVGLTPTLTLEASPSTVYPNENFTLSGALSLRQDLTHNGFVLTGDLILFARAWGTVEGDPLYNPDADMDQDGAITLSDLILFARAWEQFTGRKPVVIQQFDGEKWVPLEDEVGNPIILETGDKGVFSLTLKAPAESCILYYRAHFPGGIY